MSLDSQGGAHFLWWCLGLRAACCQDRLEGTGLGDCCSEVLVASGVRACECHGTRTSPHPRHGRRQQTTLVFWRRLPS